MRAMIALVITVRREGYKAPKFETHRWPAVGLAGSQA